MSFVPPKIILVRPQLGENIGMCARAMLNCGVTDLRIVAPRDGWPNPAAVAAASGATQVIEQAKIYDTVTAAVGDLEYILATTARPRDMVKDVVTPTDAATRLRAYPVPEKTGILFGPERAGLENDDVAVANAIINIPLNPAFSSLNLSQAVLLVCHAWLNVDNPYAAVPEQGAQTETRATRHEIEIFLTHMETAMDRGGFFRSPEKRPAVMRNIRNFFFRSDATQQEISTLHGVIKSIAGKDEN